MLSREYVSYTSQLALVAADTPDCTERAEWIDEAYAGEVGEMGAGEASRFDGIGGESGIDGETGDARSTLAPCSRLVVEAVVEAVGEAKYSRSVAILGLADEWACPFAEVPEFAAIAAACAAANVEPPPPVAACGTGESSEYSNGGEGEPECQ